VCVLLGSYHRAMDQQPHTVINKSSIPPPFEDSKTYPLFPQCGCGDKKFVRITLVFFCRLCLDLRPRMSKVSTASAKIPTQLPSQSPWAKGPPPNRNSSAPSPRSQSPPSHIPSPIAVSHTRRVPIKEGVSVPQNNVGSVRLGSSSSSPLPFHAHLSSQVQPPSLLVP
jgi:hypothetical protein